MGAMCADDGKGAPEGRQDSWETTPNLLNGNDHVFSRLGEKPFYINEGFRTLTPLILVRIQVPQPVDFAAFSFLSLLDRNDRFENYVPVFAWEVPFA